MAFVADTLNVTFKCSRFGRKLRVRAVSAGYSPDINCQFPRAIRLEGRSYCAPSTSVALVASPSGVFFYRVRAADIRILGEEVKVFDVGGDECVVCLDAPYDVVFAPCGHFCACAACAARVVSGQGVCLICRGAIHHTIPRDQL